MPLDHDAFIMSGKGGPHDDGPDYACTQAEYDAVLRVYETLDATGFTTGMPEDQAKLIIDARDHLIDWLASADEQGIQPDPNDELCKKYGA